MNTKNENLSLKTKRYIMSIFVKNMLISSNASIVKAKIDKRPLNRIAINERETFVYKNNSCI